MNAREINIFFNCLLIRNRVRQAYLSEHVKPESVTFMKHHFPDLIIRPWTHQQTPMYLVSYQPIEDSALTNNHTIGTLLGYPGADEFQGLDHAKAYIYCFEYTLQNSKQPQSQRLFGNKCATEKDGEHSLLLEKIKAALQKSPTLQQSIKDVFIHKSSNHRL